MFEHEVDEPIYFHAQQCFGLFISWTDAIIADGVVDHIVQCAFMLLPVLLECVTVLLGTKQMMGLTCLNRLHGRICSYGPFTSS